jgi:hypothetical protein
MPVLFAARDADHVPGADGEQRPAAGLDVADAFGDVEGLAGPDTTRGASRALHEVVSLALRSRIIGHDPCRG